MCYALFSLIDFLSIKRSSSKPIEHSYTHIYEALTFI